MRAQGYIILFVIFVAGSLAFGIPFVVGGERYETRDDIVLQLRYTATATPLDRALTQEAFASLFFTETASPRSIFRNSFSIFPSRTPLPTLTIPPAATGRGLSASMLTSTSLVEQLTASYTPQGFTPTLTGSTPTKLSTPNSTLTLVNTPIDTLIASPTSTAVSPPTATTVPPPTATNTPLPATNTPKFTQKPSNTPKPPQLTETAIGPSNTPTPQPSNTPPPPTDTPPPPPPTDTEPPPPTDTPPSETPPPGPGGNNNGVMQILIRTFLLIINVRL